jgi:hypothetical protein
VKSAWDAAYSLHVWGFHEAKLNVEDLEVDLPHVEWLIRYTEQTLAKRAASKPSRE